MSRLVLLLALLAACSKDNSPKGLCERGCKKLLGCAHAADSEQDPCVQACTAATPPDQASVEKLEGFSCDELMAGAAGALGRGVAPAAPPPARANNGCTADCRTCVGDGTSCFAAAGGTNGIPCDPCCCAPGGPAPVWRNEE
ncbi:MAG: hypothetical protein IPQ07_14135 [Myxococcales bacterium]|nr:hypothetical protein [Myxococcales bacterium]